MLQNVIILTWCRHHANATVMQVGFEETFNVIFRKNSTSVISGDLLDKAGVTQDIKMPYKFAGEDFPTPIPGFTVGFEMTIDLSMPFTMMSEGIAEVAVIVSAKVRGGL